MTRRTLALLASIVFAAACTSEGGATPDSPTSSVAAPSAPAAATASAAATAGATTAPPSSTADPATSTASTAPEPTSTVGASDPPSAEPTDGSTGAPVDGTTYDQERFTVVLPEGWEGVSSEDDGYQERLTELQAQYEEDEQAISSLATLESVLDGGTISFIALDLGEATRTENFIANMNVITQDLGGQSLTLEDFVALNLEALEAQEGLVGTVDQRPAQLGESEATAVTYTQEQASFQNATYQFYAVSETHAYVVTFSSDTENFEQVQPTFDQIAEGFVVK